MVRTISILSAACLFLAGCGAEAPSAPVERPSAAVELSVEEKQALARRYINALDMDENMDALMTGLTDQMLAGVDNDPNRPTEQLEAIKAAIVAGAADMLPPMMALMEEIAAEVFTTEELLAITEFYESDIGRAFVAKNPEFSTRAMSEIGPIMEMGQQSMIRRMCGVDPEMRGCDAVLAETEAPSPDAP